MQLNRADSDVSGHDRVILEGEARLLGGAAGRIRTELDCGQRVVRRVRGFGWSLREQSQFAKYAHMHLRQRDGDQWNLSRYVRGRLNVYILIILIILFLLFVDCFAQQAPC